MEIVSEYEATIITSAIDVLDKFVAETRKKAWVSSQVDLTKQQALHLGTVAERAQMSSESLFQVLNCANAYFDCPNAKLALDTRHMVESS